MLQEQKTAGISAAVLEKANKKTAGLEATRGFDLFYIMGCLWRARLPQEVAPPPVSSNAKINLLFCFHMVSIRITQLHCQAKYPDTRLLCSPFLTRQLYPLMLLVVFWQPFRVNGFRIADLLYL